MTLCAKGGVKFNGIKKYNETLKEVSTKKKEK